MRAPLVGSETYDEPPRLGSGVLVMLDGIVHVVHQNHGIRVKMFCTELHEPWKQYKTLVQDWFEAPTCVRCALHPGAIRARIVELRWRIEWWKRAGNELRKPQEVEPTL
jgi:hypothetical protein